MKTLLYITLFVFLSCNNQRPHFAENQSTDITAKDEKTNKIDISKYYTQQDTITIATEIGDTLKYAKADFNSIIDKHPEFFQSYPENPDQAYYNNNDKEEFGSEVGQDNYYQLYAYFLKQNVSSI